MYSDTVFSLTDNYGRITAAYFADKDGKVRLTDSTIDTWNRSYGFDSDGKGFTGMKTIQNVSYYFSSGTMLQNRAFTDHGVNYVAGADGRVVALPQNGWMQMDGKWYFVSDGTIIKNQKFNTGNGIYLFHRNGYMITNNLFHLYPSDEPEQIYAADQSGKILKNAWMKRPASGKWMYFDQDGIAVSAGIHTIQGQKYYFRNATVPIFNYIPELVLNEVVTDGKQTYIADQNGILHTIHPNGWNQINGYWYYFATGKEMRNEIVKIGTAYYGFDSYGRMYDNTDFYYSDSEISGYFRARSGGSLILQDTFSLGTDLYSYDKNGVGLEGYHTVNGTEYYFISGKKATDTAFRDESGSYYAADESGKLYALSNNTWTKAGNYYYYVKDGVIQKNTIAFIQGKYYGFDSYGRMYANQTFSSGFENSDLEENFRGSKGYVPKLWDYQTCHASASGALLCNQWYEDTTGKYYFDGNGIGYEGTHWIDGKRYTFSKGKVIDPAPAAKSAWVKGSKGWWYRHADGSYTKNGWEKINGKYYLFDASGYMLTGWQNVKGIWYYMNANGDMTSNAWQKLNNKWYYFNADGVMITKSWRQIAGKWYYFEADGSMAGKGWHQINGKWYYMYDSGIMATNTWIGNSYVDANGVWTKSK